MVNGTDVRPFHPYDGDEYMTDKGMHGMVDAERLTAWKEMQGMTREWTFWGQTKPLGHQILLPL